MAKKLEKIFFPKEEKIKEKSLEDEQNIIFFEGTENYNKIKSSDYITNILDKDGKVIGKKFSDKYKKVKYIELFENEKMNVLGISSKISFIHSYYSDEKEQFNPNKFIGFRYYQNGPLNSGKFFTLIRNNYSKYFILEKDLTVKDLNGKDFYDKELNSYEIAREILIEKYKNKNIGNNGDTFPEIIGYCFGLESLKQVNNFRFMEPLIVNIGEKDRIKDSIPEIMDNFIYIEPFLYDGHISVILASFVEKERYNIILDMSRHHFDTKNKNLAFLPKSLSNEDNIICPSDPIQEYSSCCLWFFGEIECLLQNKKYNSFKEIFSGTNMNIDFYVDVINYLTKEIDGIEYVLKKEEDKCKNNEIAFEIDFNRFFINFESNYYSIHKDLIYSKFLSIDNFFEKIGSFLYIGEVTYFSKCQRHIKVVNEYKNYLLFNLQYYKMLSQNERVISCKNMIMKEIKEIDSLINAFKEEYNFAFYHKNMLSYTTCIRKVLDKILLPFPFSNEEKEKILKYDTDSLIENLISGYKKIRDNIERKVRLFSEETISKEINSLNDLCFSVMNK